MPEIETLPILTQKTSSYLFISQVRWHQKKKLISQTTNQGGKRNFGKAKQKGESVSTNWARARMKYFFGIKINPVVIKKINWNIIGALTFSREKVCVFAVRLIIRKFLCLKNSTKSKIIITSILSGN